MDIVSKKKRSEIMSRVRSKETGLEKGFRKKLNSLGIHYRKNVSSLPGKPDIVFRTKRLVIFLDSCFWHGCSKHCRLPNSNRKYWSDKILKNKQRDKTTTKLLRKSNWTVIRIWEHSTEAYVQRILTKIWQKQYQN